MLTVMPEWYMAAEKELDQAVMKIAIKNCIDYRALGDSKTIDEAKKDIMHKLVWISENVNIEDRAKMLKFAKDMEKAKAKKTKGAKK